MTDRAKNRPKRVPIAEQQRTVLASATRAGYVRRWVNEDPDRIEKFKLAGWTPVDGKADNNQRQAQDGTNIGSTARRLVNRDRAATTSHAILMEIPQEFYDEDQVAKANVIDQAELAFDPTKRSQDGADYGEMKINKR